MSKWLRSICIILASIASMHSAQALQSKEVRNDSEIEAYIALDDLTRIKVENDRIRAIRNKGGELEILDDTVLGEIYIRPIQKVNKSINVFVTTQRGFTYQLKLQPQKREAEQIIIKNHALISKTSEQEHQEDGRISPFIKLIQDMEEEKEIEGFSHMSGEKILKSDEHTFALQSVYQGENLIGEIWEIEADEHHYRAAVIAEEDAALLHESVLAARIVGNKLYLVKQRVV